MKKLLILAFAILCVGTITAQSLGMGFEVLFTGDHTDDGVDTTTFNTQFVNAFAIVPLGTGLRLEPGFTFRHETAVDTASTLDFSQVGLGLDCGILASAISAGPFELLFGAKVGFFSMLKPKDYPIDYSNFLLFANLPIVLEIELSDAIRLRLSQTFAAFNVETTTDGLDKESSYFLDTPRNFAPAVGMTITF